MAPRRKSLSFLTLRKNNQSTVNQTKTKENEFLHSLCDFSHRIGRRQSRRLTSYPLNVCIYLILSKLESIN